MTEARNTRTVAREAVKANLSQTAFELTRQRGFHNITVDDMAAAAGVSRSTLLRYFGSKEEVVLSAFDVHVVQFADALRARPPAEDDWSALRASLGGIVDFYLGDPVGALAITRLVFNTPALYVRQLQKQHSWRPALTAALVERAGRQEGATVAMEVRVAAGLACLTIAVERWAASEGKLSMTGLLDEAFDVVSSIRAPGQPAVA